LLDKLTSLEQRAEYHERVTQQWLSRMIRRRNSIEFSEDRCVVAVCHTVAYKIMWPPLHCTAECTWQLPEDFDPTLRYIPGTDQRVMHRTFVFVLIMYYAVLGLYW